MKNIFAENLVNLRKRSKMTQEKLAARLGVSFQSVSKWENAQGYPDIELIPVIASVFGVSVDALLGYQAEKIQTTLYAEKYRDEEYYWGNRIWSGCYEVLKQMPPVRPLRLLDIGCGEGQAAVFFARNGYQVSAFDITESGIEKGKRLAERSGVSVNFFRADLLDYRMENGSHVANGSGYDIVFASGSLQYIPPEKRAEILRHYKEHTAPGGIHVMNVFVEKPYLPTPPDWEEKEYFWKTGELFYHYSDWKMERMEEYVFDCDSGGARHQHCMDVMIGRRHRRHFMAEPEKRVVRAKDGHPDT